MNDSEKIYRLEKVYPKKSVAFRVTKNGQQFTLRSAITFKNMWVKKVMCNSVYTTFEFLKIQLDNSSMNQVNYANDSKDYFFVAPINASGTIAYTRDFDEVLDYSNASVESIRTFGIHIYIGDTYLSDAVLADNPVLLEIGFE